MRIEVLGYADLEWPMGTQETTPQYRVGTGTYQRAIKVDPFPAYPHDIAVVQPIANLCETMFPLKDAKVGIWLIGHDFLDRLNGITYEDYIYRREDGTEWQDEIMCYCGCGKPNKMYGQALTVTLAAKRIPIHPAMTRYLVSHEYGHAVFDYITRKMGYKDHEQDTLKAKYMEVRGVQDYTSKYSGGKWHAAPGEIIANDFRVLFTKQEIEFWPHNCPLPNWNESVGNWWRDAMEICKVKKGRK